MISRMRWMAICFGLVVWSWYATSAFLQERPASQQAAEVGRPIVAAVVSGNPWDAINWIERRYKIEAMRFKARDETGWDWAGSDEVMVSTSDSKGWTVSDEIGGINSDDTHNFDPAKSCIIAVRPGTVVLGKSSVCDDVGEPAPLGFGVEFWEKDWSSDFCAVGSPGPGLHGGPHCTHYGNDDFIGRARLDFTAQELEAALPKVGDVFIETVVLNPCSGDGVCDVTWGPDYTFTYRITRLPDVRVDLRPVLDEARQKIGARSDIEAMAAGLRSLAAPSPRKIEPGTAKLSP
jgi:hypothetical protein